MAVSEKNVIKTDRLTYACVKSIVKKLFKVVLLENIMFRILHILIFYLR